MIYICKTKSTERIARRLQIPRWNQLHFRLDKRRHSGVAAIVALSLAKEVQYSSLLIYKLCLSGEVDCICAVLMQVLCKNRNDFPFALYLAKSVSSLGLEKHMQ